MSSRACVHVAQYADALGGESPNSYIPRVTVDLRVYYPPVAGNYLAAADALYEAYIQASLELATRFPEESE